MNMNGNSTSVALPNVEIYTDGGCEPNPGPGGYGVVLVHPKKRAEASGGFRLTTNNLKKPSGSWNNRRHYFNDGKRIAFPNAHLFDGRRNSRRAAIPAESAKARKADGRRPCCRS